MIKKMLTALAVALLGLALGATPATASESAYLERPTVLVMTPINGCQDAWVCVYSNGQGTGGGYGFHVQNLFGSTCWAYPFSGQGGWPNGAVANQISSIILNHAGINGGGHYVTFHDDSYCGNTYKGSFNVALSNSLQVFGELSYNSPQPSVNWDNSINSVSWH